MTPSLVLLCLAASAVLAATASGLSGLGLLLGRRALTARSPAAQARILLGLALLPAFATVTVMAAALAPSFGWIADHCGSAPQLPAHPHICSNHESVLPALPITILAAAFVLRTLLAGFRLGVSTMSARRVRRDLAGGAVAKLPGGAWVLPLDEPQAFVLGVLRPSLFLTRGLLAPEHRDHLEAVLAHERAHLVRRDPARRVLASLAFAFHLPGIAAAIERWLARAHEMAADEDASTVVGSRSRVARALVHLARARIRPLAVALAFADSDLELRVRALLEERGTKRGPLPQTLMVLAGAGVAGIASGAEAVHHGVEVVLGLLGG